MVLSRINDAFLSIPSIMLGLVMIAAIGSTIPILIVLTGLIYATSVFRIARAFGQDVMVSDFVEAARVRGEGLWWIITREILPNVVMPLVPALAIATLTISINMIVDDISAHSGGKLAKEMI